MYFVCPYESLTTDFTDAGIHMDASSNDVQVSLRIKNRTDYIFEKISDDSICYDVNFENKCLYSVLGLSKEELTLDLNSKKLSLHKRYLLTTKRLNYRIVTSYKLEMRPIELNVIYNIPGKDIFLYDTSETTKNKFYTDERVEIWKYQHVGKCWPLGFAGKLFWSRFKTAFLRK